MTQQNRFFKNHDFGVTLNFTMNEKNIIKRLLVIVFYVIMISNIVV